MKKNSRSFAAVFAAAITAALAAVFVPTGAAAQVAHHLDPTVVATGKELPRSGVVSHGSKADAVRGKRGESRYLQPLAEWTRTEGDEWVSYTARFKVPFEWIDRQQFLYLERVTGSFDVVVNGVRTAYSQTGSSPSEFDITKAAREGANDLEIIVYKNPVARRLENGRPPAGPQIEGEAYILSQPQVRVRDVVVNARTEGTNGLLELGVILKSHRLNAHDYAVYWELLNPAGEIMAEGRRDVRIDMQREDTVRFFANIPRVVPWGHEDPRLYTLLVKTRNEGRFREYMAFKVGFRTIGLGRDGALALNGVPLPLSMREFSPTGDMAAMREQIGTLRSEGVNGLMLTGVPPSQEFMALCDSLGMYLACTADIDTSLSGEGRRMGENPSNDPAWEGAYLDRTLAMYHTSRNHPSVAAFRLASGSANGYNLYETYLALKGSEPLRPVFYTDGGGEWNSDPFDPLAGSGAGSGVGSVVGSGVGSAVVGSDAGSGVGVASPATAADRVTLEAVNVAEGVFRVGNASRFTPFIGEAVYRLAAGVKVVASGCLPLEVAPGAMADLTIPLKGVKKGQHFTVSIEIAEERPVGDYLPPGDPDLKVYRRPGQPLAAAHRAVILNDRFKSGE